MVWHAQRFRNQYRSSASFAWGTGEQSCAKAVCGRSVDALEMKKHQRLHSDVATTSCELLLCGFLSSNTPTSTVPRWLVAKDQAFACESKKHRVPPMRQCALRLQRSHRGSHIKRVDTCRQKYQKVSIQKKTKKNTIPHRNRNSPWPCHALSLPSLSSLSADWSHMQRAAPARPWNRVPKTALLRPVRHELWTLDLDTSWYQAVRLDKRWSTSVNLAIFSIISLS